MDFHEALRLVTQGRTVYRQNDEILRLLHLDKDGDLQDGFANDDRFLDTVWHDELDIFAEDLESEAWECVPGLTFLRAMAVVADGGMVRRCDGDKCIYLVASDTGELLYADDVPIDSSVADVESDLEAIDKLYRDELQGNDWQIVPKGE